MKKILFAAIIAGAMFACNKQDDATTDPGEVKYENTVMLNVTQGVSAKGVTNQTGNPEYAVIGSAKIYFIDASSNYVSQRELTAAEINTLANTSTTAGGNTVTINGVPSTATTLYFLANIKTTDGSSFPIVDGTTTTDARLRIDRLQGEAIHVPMAGQSNTFVGSGTSFTASVDIKPLVSRLEIGEVTCQNASGTAATVDSDITEYKLAGVFINNVRQSVLLSGDPYLVGSSINIQDQTGWANTGWDNMFTSINTVFPYYPAGTPSAPIDWVANAMATYCAPTAAGLSFYPNLATGATITAPTGTPLPVWGYQVCPSTTVSGSTPADVPHIILRLTNVKYVNDNFEPSVKYVTITKYVEGSTPVTEFKRGHVYRITNLTFDFTKATPKPYDKNITVTATVSVIPWEIHNINPDWN